MITKKIVLDKEVYEDEEFSLEGYVEESILNPHLTFGYEYLYDENRLKINTNDKEILDEIEDWIKDLMVQKYCPVCGCVLNHFEKVESGSSLPYEEYICPSHTNEEWEAYCREEIGFCGRCGSKLPCKKHDKE